MKNYRIENTQAFLRWVMTVFQEADAKIDVKVVKQRPAAVMALALAEGEVLTQISKTAQNSPVDEAWMQNLNAGFVQVNEKLADLDSSLALDIKTLTDEIRFSYLIDMAAASSSSAQASGSSVVSASTSRDALFSPLPQTSQATEIMETTVAMSEALEKSPDGTLTAGSVSLTLRSPNRSPSQNKVAVALLDASSSMQDGVIKYEVAAKRKTRFGLAIEVLSGVLQSWAEKDWDDFHQAFILPFGCESFQPAQVSDRRRDSSADPAMMPLVVGLDQPSALEEMTTYLRKLKQLTPQYATYLAPAIEYVKQYFSEHPHESGEKPALTFLVNTDGAISDTSYESSVLQKEQFLVEELERQGFFDLCSSISVVFVQIAGEANLTLCTKYIFAERERYFAETLTVSSLEVDEFTHVTESAIRVLGAEKTIKPITLRFTQGEAVLETLQLGVLPLDIEIPIHFSLAGVQSNMPIRVEVLHGVAPISIEERVMSLDEALALDDSFVASIGEALSRLQRQPSHKQTAVELVSLAVKAGNIPEAAAARENLEKIKRAIDAQLQRCERQLSKEDVDELQARIPPGFQGEIVEYLKDLSLRKGNPHLYPARYDRSRLSTLESVCATQGYSMTSTVQRATATFSASSVIYDPT